MRIDQRTVDAQRHGLLTQLLNQSASVPWDARAALDATVDDLSETMVREHLRACSSALLDEPDARTIYRKMDIVRRVNAHEVPRNVALLFFFPRSRAVVPGGEDRSRPPAGGNRGRRYRGEGLRGRPRGAGQRLSRLPSPRGHRFGDQEGTGRISRVAPDQLSGRRTARSVGERAFPPRLRPGFAPYNSGSRHVRPDRHQKHAGAGPGNRQGSAPPGSHAAAGAPAQSANRRVVQGDRTCRKASHGPGQDISSDGA